MSVKETENLSEDDNSNILEVDSTTITVNDMNLPLDSLAETASSFASVHGILVERRQTDFGDDTHAAQQTTYFECAPISLLPNAFPATAFAQAQAAAPHFNRLVEVASQNAEFLQSALSQVVEADPFTAQLWKLYQDIYLSDDKKNTFAKQADRLGLLRSDYMLHEGGIKQVELNTIASSFGALSTRVAALHRHLTTTCATNKAVQTFLLDNKQAILKGDDASELGPNDGVPENFALERLAQALHLAAQNYSAKRKTDQKPVILFVVQPGETNTVDQRLLEFQITQAHGWRVLRHSLTELSKMASVDAETGALTLVQQDDDDAPEEEVAVVYYRAGYAPTDYFGPAEWKAREILETSLATKSPCLGYHLVGTKKVQQALARPGVLESLLGDEGDVVSSLRSVFAGLFSLGPDMVDEDKEAVTNILQRGDEGKYVLKPQREGGGYNFYGTQMADRLRPHITFQDDAIQSIDHSILSEFILMERLFPPEQRAILLRSGQVEGSGLCISELGCFGAVLWDGSTNSLVHNDYAGFLLRTKFSHVDEGGVAAGFATLSSPYLV